MSLFSLGGFLGDAIADIWMSIWLSLNNMIYYFISALYQVFESVANTNLFSNDVFEKITSRIYIIMGIAMLFIFAYNLVLMIINPEDKKGTGQTTKVVKEVMISLVLIILLPTIFNYMSIFQKHVLKTQILSQIIFGDTGGTSSEGCDYSEYTVFNTVDIETSDNSSATEYLSKYCKNYSEKLSSSQRGAYALPITIFQAFYYPTTVDYDTCEEWIENNKDGNGGSLGDDEKKMCAYYVYDVKLSKYKGNITPFNSESKFYSKVKKDDGTFEFHYLLALVAGVLALYMFMCYTLAIGVRVAKLGFLQIISPIAVMMRIVPKQKEAMFDKWFKQLLDTYLDVFIRLIIIYFALFSISLVPDTIKTLFASIEGSNWFIRALSCVVVILGILQFAQKAPELFKEFFGSSGNFALKSPSKQLSENKLAKGIVGGAGVMGTIAGKNIYDTVGNFKKNGFVGGLKSTAKGMPRAMGQQFTGAYRGFKKGKEAQSFGDMRDGIYGTAASELSKATMKDKLLDFGAENKDAFTGFYKANYTPYNSPAELRKAKKLEAVAEKQKAFEELLDNSDQVKGVDSYYEGRIKKAQADGATLEQMQALQEEWRKKKHEARAQAYQVKGNDVDVKAALASYKEELSKNLSIVNEAIEENTELGKTPNKITDVDAYLSEDNLRDVSKYKNTREAGSASKKSAANIRQRAIQEEKKAKGGS